MCPTCSKRIDLGDHGLEGLMNNYLIRNLVDLVSSTDDNMPELPSAMQQWSANNASPLCQSCEDDHPPANTVSQGVKYRCNDCDYRFKLSYQILNFFHINKPTSISPFN